MISPIQRAAGHGRWDSLIPPSCCRRRGLRRRLVPHLFVPGCFPGDCRFHGRPRAQHSARNMLVQCTQGCRNGGARLVLRRLPGRLSHRGFAYRRRAEHGRSNARSGLQGPVATAAAAVSYRWCVLGAVHESWEASDWGYNRGQACSSSPGCQAARALRPVLSWPPNAETSGDK